MEKKLFAKRVVEVGYMKRISLEESLEESPVMDKNGFEYFIHALCDGCLPISMRMLDDAADDIVSIFNSNLMEFPNKVVCVESMGIPIGVAVAQKMEKELNFPVDLVIVRKRDYGSCFPNQIAIEADKWYQKDVLYINGVDSNDLIFLVDDVIASGNTLNQTIKAIRYAGASIVGAGAIVEIDGATEKIDPAIETFALVNLTIKNGKVVIL